METEPSDPGAEFRRLMARWATGVAVVTSRSPDGDVGLTVNALLSVTLEPPTLLVSLSEGADTTPVVVAQGIFAASFLSAAQRALSERFAAPTAPAEKFAGLSVHRGVTGAALLDGALGAVECRVTRVIPLGDHRLVAGEVVGLETGPDALPLLFVRRGYARPAGDERLELPRA